MLNLMLIVLFFVQLGHLGWHWFSLTTRLAGEQRDERIKSHLNWKDMGRKSKFGSSRRGSALRRA